MNELVRQIDEPIVEAIKANVDAQLVALARPADLDIDALEADFAAELATLTWDELFTRIGDLKLKIRTELDPATVHHSAALGQALDYTEQLIIEFGEVHGPRMRELDPELWRAYCGAWTIRSWGHLRCSRAICDAARPRNTEKPRTEWRCLTLWSLWRDIEVVGKRLSMLETALQTAKPPAAEARTILESIEEQYKPLVYVHGLLERLRGLREQWLDAEGLVCVAEAQQSAV